MRKFIFQVIKDAANQIGVECVLEEPTSSNTTMPNPRIEVVFMPDSLITTGKKLSKYADGEDQITVHERYEVDSSVMLFLRDNNDDRIRSNAMKLILAFPKGIADMHNNWVRIRASQAEWSGFKATTVGINKIEPIKARTYSIRVGFMWRLTYKTVTPYITKFKLIGDFNE